MTFRYTHELGAKVNAYTRYFPDRMFSIKPKIIEEKQYIPSISFGVQDFGSLFSFGNQYFSTSYIVLSKKFNFKQFKIDFTLGNGFDFFDLKAKSIKGFFGGIRLKQNKLNSTSLIIENDSQGYNLVITQRLFSKLILTLGIWDLNKLTFSLNYNL